MLMLAGCCAAAPVEPIQRTYSNVREIEYRADGSVVITFETGRVIVVRDGKESEAF